jgi:hypothetical protein
MSSMDTDFGMLSVEVEAIDVTSSLPRADKNWRFADTRGHEHYWQDGWPTLVRVVDGTWTDEDGEEHEESHLECLQCGGEHVEPGMVGPDGFREFMPGMRRYLLDGVEISEERAQEIIAAARRRVADKEATDG